MQKVMYKGLVPEDKTLREIKVTSGAKIMVVGSTINDVLAVNTPKDAAQQDAKAEENKKEPLCRQKVSPIMRLLVGPGNLQSGYILPRISSFLDRAHDGNLWSGWVQQNGVDSYLRYASLSSGWSVCLSLPALGYDLCKGRLQLAEEVTRGFLLVVPENMTSVRIKPLFLTTAPILGVCVYMCVSSQVQKVQFCKVMEVNRFQRFL